MVLILPISIAASFFLYQYDMTKGLDVYKSQKKPAFFLGVTVIGIINSILVTEKVCTFFLDILNMIGVIENLHAAFLGNYFPLLSIY